jgi:hypothetical protein
MPEGSGEFGVCSLMAEQDYTRRQSDHGRKEVETSRIVKQNPREDRLTPRAPLLKIDEL